MKRFLRMLMGVMLGGIAFQTVVAADTAPLLVEGSFSSHATQSAEVVFDQEARDAEVAELNRQLQQRQYTEVIQRINDLTAHNFLDNRFFPE